MRLTICAVGRLRSGPERALVDDYLERFNRTGRSIGLGPASVAEVDDRRGGGMSAEAELLSRSLPARAVVCCLDQRGEMLTSQGFAGALAGWRDGGRTDAAFVIGGADGVDPSLRQRADLVVSLGPMVWPHLLARVLLAEQLYRAATILVGTPYHRA
jgi:23S rRNA (pseudouridine1915-N3)-methyltransferase